MSDRPDASPLSRAKLRREALAEAADALDDAVTRPAGDAVAWKQAVDSAVTAIDRALDAHIDEVEGPNGLYHEIIERSPRLVHHVEVLEREHVALRADVAKLAHLLEGPDGPNQIAQLREEAVRLLGDISRHRHRGADLIFDSYDFDIGGEGD
jgi:DUF438 domain-containing protein